MPAKHPVTGIFPDMNPQEFYDLKQDIKQHGLKVPILLWRGQLVDGRHRLKACEGLGIMPRFETIDCTEEELPALVWSLNATRRQLTKSQRAMAANLIFDLSSQGGRPKKLEYTAEENLLINKQVSTEIPATQAQAAQLVGVSRSQIQKAATVFKEDQGLAHAVHQGKLTLGQATKEIEYRKTPPAEPPPQDLPNLKYREWLAGANRALKSLEDYLLQITEYSRPPVPDDTGWNQELELKQKLEAVLTETVPKLCRPTTGAAWQALKSKLEN